MSWWIVAPEIYHLYLHISTFFGCYFACWWTERWRMKIRPGKLMVFFFGGVLCTSLEKMERLASLSVIDCWSKAQKPEKEPKGTKHRHFVLFWVIILIHTTFLFFSVKLIANDKTSIHSSGCFLAKSCSPKCSPTKISKRISIPHMGRKQKKSCSPRKLSWHGHIHKLKEVKDFFLTNFYPAFATTLSWCRLEGWTWTC